MKIIGEIAIEVYVFIVLMNKLTLQGRFLLFGHIGDVKRYRTA
jgi:hypothetical protein